MSSRRCSFTVHTDIRAFYDLNLLLQKVLTFLCLVYDFVYVCVNLEYKLRIVHLDSRMCTFDYTHKKQVHSLALSSIYNSLRLYANKVKN